MAYKVFISHSTRDWKLAITLANILKKFGIEDVFVAEWYLTQVKSLTGKRLLTSTMLIAWLFC